MSFDDELKDLDDLDFDEADEIRSNNINNFQLNQKNYLKDIDDLSDEEESGSDFEVDDDNPTQNQQLDSKDIVKLVKAKLSSSVGLFRKSTKYQNQFNTIKNKVQQQQNDLINGDGSCSRPTAVVQLSSGMNIINIGNLNTDREYQLILDCNKLIHDIDDEIAETHR